MNFPWRCSLPLALFACGGPALAQIDGTIRDIQAEVRPAEAMDRMYRIYSTDRWFNFPKFQETTDYLKGALAGLGLQGVEVVAPPADGVTQYGFWTMPLAWDVKQATLEIIEPSAPPDMRFLADYQKVPASLGMWSSPTPPGGVTADVVELQSPAEIDNTDLKGKMVLVRQGPSAYKLALIGKGAAGIMTANTENPNLRDGHGWVNSWGDSGWGYTRTSTPLVCFSITPRQADYISGLLARGGKVRVRASVESRYYTGAYPYATGVIEGRGSDEEVLVLGHTAEQGANDNAAGVSVMLEAVATLKRLIDAGRLKPPRRAIRILAMPELYASMHYVIANPERLRRTVAAICVDSPAGPYDAEGSEITLALNPDVARSYADALILRIADGYFGARRFWRWEPAGMGPGGTDTYFSDPMIGTPTIWAKGGLGVSTHHNSEDTPDRVDPRSIRDLTVLTATYLYYLASAGDAEVPWLAQITADRGYENILRAARPSLESAEAAATAEDLSRALRDGLEQIAYGADRDKEAVLSTLRLASPRTRRNLEAALAPTLDGLRRFAEGQSGRLGDAVNRRAAALGIAGPVKPLPPARLTEAARMIVKRKRVGTITLDDLPRDQWEGQPSASWNGTLIAALNWCDGRRNLAEVIRLTTLERGPLRVDLVAWFRFLAKHGYVELTAAAP